MGYADDKRLPDFTATHIGGLDTEPDVFEVLLRGVKANIAVRIDAVAAIAELHVLY